MVDSRANQVLNRLLIVLSRSMPMYVSHAAPWVSYNGDQTRDALDHLVADQKQYVERVTRLLQDRRYTIDPGEFPMTFTDLHDLSLGFLSKRMAEQHRLDVQAIERCVQQLQGDAEGRALAEEILDNAREHLHSLDSLGAQSSAK
jgi:hypothetical protein